MKAKHLIMELVLGMFLVAGCVSSRHDTGGLRAKDVLKSITPHVSATKLTPLYAFSRFNKILANETQDTFLVHPYAETCDEYIYAHAPSVIKYDIPRNTKRFFAVGFSGSSKNNAFRVLVDERVLFESRELAEYPQFSVTIDIPIPQDGKIITLITDPMGSTSGDWTVWCWPRFYE